LANVTSNNNALGPGGSMPSIKINALSQWVSYGVNVLIMFFLIPFVINKLDKTGFGIWRFAITFVGYYGLLNLAVSSSITRYVARYAGKGDSKSLNETISTAIAIYLFSAVIAIGISVVFAANIVNFFDKTPPELITEFNQVIRILGVATGMSFLAALLSAIVTAQEHYVVINVTGITLNLLRAVLTVVFLIKGMGLVGVAWANLIPTVAGVIVNYFVCRRFTPTVKITVLHARFDVLRTLLLYSATTMVIALADMLRGQIDSTVIGKMIGFEKVAIFGIAGSLIGQIVSFTIAGIGVLTPRFASLEGRGYVEELRKLFVKSLHYSALLGFGLCLMTFIWGGNFIRLWVGDGFIESIPILWILTLALITDLAQSPGVGMMFALNKHRFYAVASIVEGITKLGLTLVLVREIGIIGAALATAIPMVAVRVFVQPFYVARIVRIPLREYLKPFLIPFVSGGLIVGGCYLIGAFSNHLASNWFALAVYVAASVVAFAALTLGLSHFWGIPEISINRPFAFVYGWKKKQG
jgi:O-antigen/teichoic acid export membrane protein